MKMVIEQESLLRLDVVGLNHDLENRRLRFKSQSTRCEQHLGGSRKSHLRTTNSACC